MPKVLHTNDGIRESVTRPVVFDITRQIQEWTGLEQMNILFPGDSEVAVQPGSTISEEPAFNRTLSQPLWRVNVREEHRTEKLLATAVHQMEHQEFFYDESIGVYLRPVYSPTLLTLEFEYRSSDVNNARRWRDEVRAKVSTNRDVRTHSVNYHFMIPKEYLPLLTHIHTLREAQAGYGETLEVYLKNHFTQNVTKLATLAGTEERWAIAEQQGRIMGQFEFRELPDDPEKQGETSAYRQVFSYRIFYDCPIATAADYPILVHNQLIDQQWLMIAPKDDVQRYESRSPRSVTALAAFEVDRMAKPTVLSGLRLPEFHEFYPKSVPRKTLQILSALIGIEPVTVENPNNRKIMNFDEIDEKWEFRPEFIDYLKYDHEWLHKYGESLVNVTVYDNDMPLHHTLFEIDADLNVVVKFEPDLRRVYYVRISLFTDPTELSTAARDRARNNAEGLILIGAAMAPDLVKKNQLPQVLGNSNYIPRNAGELFFQRIRQHTIGHHGGHLAEHTIMSWNTVMILYIEADSKAELSKQE